MTTRGRHQSYSRAFDAAVFLTVVLLQQQAQVVVTWTQHHCHTLTGHNTTVTHLLDTTPLSHAGHTTVTHWTHYCHTLDTTPLSHTGHTTVTRLLDTTPLSHAYWTQHHCHTLDTTPLSHAGHTTVTRLLDTTPLSHTGHNTTVTRLLDTTPLSHAYWTQHHCHTLTGHNTIVTHLLDIYFVHIATLFLLMAPFLNITNILNVFLPEHVHIS